MSTGVRTAVIDLLNADTHTWAAEPTPCPLTNCNETHFLRCIACGIRRYGGYAEHGCYHYFVYEQVPGSSDIRTDYIPPCGDVTDIPGITVRMIIVCATCHCLREDTEQPCQRCGKSAVLFLNHCKPAPRSESSELSSGSP